MQTTANGTVANSLPENVVILLTLLISKRYIPYANLHKFCNMERREFVSKIKNFISRESLLNEDDRVLVALSGGADSVALLSVLREIGYECVAVHYNFHLRGEESMRDERFVNNFCNRHGVKLHVKDFDVDAYVKDNGVSIEMACRELRYEWFETIREMENCHRIAVAHHSNDNVETLFLNLLRVTGIAGVAGIKPVNGNVVRPMLCVSRADIEDYLRQTGQDYVVDSTNAESDVKRNKLRNIVLPVMEKCFPESMPSLVKSIANLYSCNELYESLVNEKLGKIVKKDGRDGILLKIDMKDLSRIRGAGALLHYALKEFGFNSTQSNLIFETYNNRENSTGKRFYAGRHVAFLDRDMLEILDADAFSDGNTDYVVDLSALEIREPVGMKVLLLRKSEFDMKSCDGRNKVCFSAKLGECRNLLLRHWEKGDRFKPFGMKGRSRLVSDLFSDMKFDESQKRNCWLLEADGDIIWVLGCRAGDLYRVGDNDEYLYYMELA